MSYERIQKWLNGELRKVNDDGDYELPEGASCWVQIGKFEVFLSSYTHSIQVYTRDEDEGYLNRHITVQLCGCSNESCNGSVQLDSSFGAVNFTSTKCKR